MKKAVEDKQYWLTVWSRDTWRDFLKAGGEVYGLPARYEKRAKQISIGDHLICYMKGTSEFFAVLKVTSKSFWDNTQIWEDDIYPVRFFVREVIKAHTGIKALDLLKQLSLYTRLANPSNPKSWGNHFHQSIRTWNREDSKLVIEALKQQVINERRRQ